uniref:Uncharacterized protein n=1 Tax=Manihot esculenta TaxID=3983 RepID=A0A2C9W4A5_MANES
MQNQYRFKILVIPCRTSVPNSTLKRNIRRNKLEKRNTRTSYEVHKFSAQSEEHSYTIQSSQIQAQSDGND